MSEHTAGRLRCSDNATRLAYDYYQAVVLTEDSRIFCEPCGDTPTEAAANAKRLVDCWNAHDGLVEALRRVSRIGEELSGHPDEFAVANASDDIQRIANAALAAGVKQ